MGEALVNILVVLVAAKVAAEVAERLRVPAVAGEIVAGILIGPSVLGMVHGDEVLHALGELGVILLLLQVGMEMDLADLRAVGRASLLVAVIGVAAPFALGFGVASAFGHGGSTAVFLGAALTATSVGITARVFGDLRALATTEARIVLGAAVADDILGLVILTVVVRAVSEGSVSAASVLGIIALAVVFLGATVGAGTRLVPPLFRRIHGLARSPGTFLGLTMAFTLAAAQLATTARLAPIIGAFVAGLALSRSEHVERIHHETAPLAHLFVPVFFLQIGIDTDLDALARPEVLGLAAALLAVAVVGKLIAGLGAAGTRTDKFLIGLGMLPRGEVGLIFAGLGKEAGVLGPDLYGALLLVVLGTTLFTPPALAGRLRRGRRAAAPGDDDLLVRALEAALVADARPPDRHLVDRLAAEGGEALRWDRRATDLLVAVLRRGSTRSWRFLEATGVLARALPELATALDRRRADPYELDAAGLHRWAVVDRLHEVVEDPALATVHVRVERPDSLLLAAFALDATGDDVAVEVARRLATRLDIDPHETVRLVADHSLLVAAARRPDAMDEGVVVQLAGHLGTTSHAAALYLLTLASTDVDRVTRGRIDALYELVDAVLSHGVPADDLVSRRRAEAEACASDLLTRERVAYAPTGLILAQDPAVLARQCRLLEPMPERRRAHVEVVAGKEGEWTVDVACRDRPGLLAVVTGVLAASGIDVVQATAATWPDGGALESFVVRATMRPDPVVLAAAIEAALREPLASAPMPDAEVAFDDEASPWHTICDARAPDRPGVLHALAVAFAHAGADVQGVHAATVDGVARDRFELVDRRGRKLDAATRAAVADALASGVQARRRSLR